VRVRDLFSLSGRVALVTGGSRGLGLEIATGLGEAGAAVAITARRDSWLQSAEQALRAERIECLALSCDVSDPSSVGAAVRETLARFGRIDALVNNAGTTKVVPHDDLDGLSAEDFQRIFALNVIAPFQMVRACRAALKETRGAIVNVSSVASRLGTGSSVAYAASKAALETMTYSLARSLAPEVRVNAVAPGHTNTPWHPAVRGSERAAEVERRYAGIAPLKAVSEAEDVADAIVWLITGARKVTGEVIYVDGGMHIAAPR
jgi:3-oxoacyl-[acyl-carrier protein] reductase